MGSALTRALHLVFIFRVKIVHNGFDSQIDEETDNKTFRHASCQYLSKCEVDSVGQRCDDQPTVQSHVLVTIAEGSRTLSDIQLVWFPVPVESQLALPFKLPGV